MNKVKFVSMLVSAAAVLFALLIATAICADNPADPAKPQISPAPTPPAPEKTADAPEQAAPAPDNAAHVRPMKDWKSALKPGTGEPKEFKWNAKVGDAYLKTFKMEVTSRAAEMKNASHLEIIYEIRQSLDGIDNNGNFLSTFSVTLKKGIFNDKDLPAAAGEKTQLIKALITPQGNLVKDSIDKSALGSPKTLNPEWLLAAALPALPKNPMKTGEAVSIREVVPEYLLSVGIGKLTGESQASDGVYEFVGIEKSSSGAERALFKSSYEYAKTGKPLGGSDARVEVISLTEKNIVFDINSGYVVSITGFIEVEQLSVTGKSAIKIAGKSAFALDIKREEAKPAEPPKDGK
jgi:hypothetical protein